MKFEHFGISIVEMMAAGIITIAHNSAGPKQDIIGAATDGEVGFLGEDADSYTKILVDCAENYSSPKFNDLRFRARKWVKTRFGVSVFDKTFTDKALIALS
jgi:alpha-1,2-mannosyltransferase